MNNLRDGKAGAQRAPVGMLTRGLSLLLELGKHPAGVGLSELARRCSLPTSTAYRLLTDLYSLGFISFDEGSRNYALGLAVFKLSHAVSAVQGLSEIARPAMQRVSEVTGETCLLSVLDGREIVYIERTNSSVPVQITAQIGRRSPMHCTSMGKALLAFQPDAEKKEILGQLRLERFTPSTIVTRRQLVRELEQVRQRGYAVADEEYDLGIRAVGVPVFDTHGRPAAAICVSAPAYRTPREKLETLVPALQEAAATIGIQLTGANRDLNVRRARRAG